MTVKDYTKICLEFAKDTENWGQLQPGCFYQSNLSANSWDETVDGSAGCIDIHWAFHLSPEEIREKAPQAFMSAIYDLLMLAVDDKWDLDAIYNLIVQVIEPY